MRFIKQLAASMFGWLLHAPVSRMAEFGPQETVTGFAAAADLSGKQYHFVRASAANACNQSSLASDTAVLGVLQNNPQSGQAATIAQQGLSKVVAGGSITVNALVTTNGSGRAAAAVSGDMVMGRALEAAANDGEVITVALQPPVRWAS